MPREIEVMGDQVFSAIPSLLELSMRAVYRFYKHGTCTFIWCHVLQECTFDSIQSAVNCMYNVLPYVCSLSAMVNQSIVLLLYSHNNAL